MDLSIVIPCYNEAENISKLKEELLPAVYELSSSKTVEVVFIDDGSTDDTYQMINETFIKIKIPNVSMKLVKHNGNWGLGKAIRTGFETSCGEVVITSDSDGTYKFSSIQELLSLLDENVDIVTASPYHPQGDVVGVPAYRLILSQGSSMIYRILVDYRIHTYTCLFRAYRRSVITDIKFVSNGFLAGTELIVKALLKGFRVVEYPAVLYTRSYGASKAKLFRTVLAHLRFQLNVLLHHLHLISLIQRDGNNNMKMWFHTKYSWMGGNQE
jgi:dolichol-phosphate mannosyltransferase